MPPHLCNFIKRGDHRPCEVMVRDPDAHAFCGTHAPIAARLPPRVAGQCEHIIGAGRGMHWCARAVVAGDRLCPNHVRVREAEAEHFRQQIAARHAGLWAEAHADIAAPRPARHVDPLHVMAQAGHAAPAAAGGYYGAAGPPRPELERLALDRQNVHTAAVAKQTTEGEAKLLAVKTDGRPVGLRILRVFAARGGQLHDVLKVMNDIDHWYMQRNCRAQGDRLYGRLLEGLWAMIDRQPAEARDELRRRLWEETSESVGMCCEGHISRLVNVMVGFDEGFKPPMSQGELLQAKMAEFAGMSAETDVKLAYARAYMDGLGLPADQQAPWLEALA